MLKGVVVGFVLAVIILEAGSTTISLPVWRRWPRLTLPCRSSGCCRTWRSTRTSASKPRTIPVAADETTYLAGAQVYKQHCAMCHGLPGQPPTDYETTMFPEPPQLFRGKGVTDDPASESYWKTANGIRLTGMPRLRPN